MKKNQYKGLFIVFEGLDGSGQSTQANLLNSRLTDDGYATLLTKEPTNNIIGGLIRGQLTHDWTANMECLQLLFAADRAHHLFREILPALRDSRIVVCDRYFMSTVAFGSIELERDWLLELNKKFIYPDAVFLLKVPAKICIQRMQESRFEMELFEREEKLKKVWAGFEFLSEKFPNVYVIDGTQSRAQISGEILEITKKLLKKKNITRKVNLFDEKNVQ